MLTTRDVCRAILYTISALLVVAPMSAAQASSASATHQCSGYNSPAMTAVHCEFSYETERQLLSLLWAPSLPTQWNLDAVSGDGHPEISSNAQVIVLTGLLTNNPVCFQFLVSVPPGEEGPKQIKGYVEYQLDNMVNPTSIWANPDPLFVDSHHRIDAWADAHGWISPSGVVTVKHGGSVSFDMGAETYYHISNVVVDTIPVGATNSYVFTDVTCDRTIAVFSAENLACRGTPEWWLALHGLTNAATDFCAAETNDTDGDDMPAWQEWVADTIPTNADSVLSFLNIRRTNDDVRVEWKGGTSAWQSLQIRYDLAATTEQWLAVFTNEPPTSETTNYLHQSVTNRILFYRLKAWR